MIGSKQTQNNNSSKPWFTLRLINSLPLVPSIKQYYPAVQELYQNTKISNPYLSLGLDYAEDSLSSLSAPILSRYQKLDAFAESKFEKLEEVYDEGIPTLAKKGALQGVRAVAYPVGFTMELANQARGLALELVAPTIEKAYDVANGVIDGILPADSDELAFDDVSGLSKLQRKSPSRRIRRRLNINSLVKLPYNTFNYSLGFASVFTYEGMMLAKVVRDQFLFRLDNSLHLLLNLEAAMLARPSDLLHNSIYQARNAVHDGQHLLQSVLVNALSRAGELEHRLNDVQLPKTAHLVHRLSSDLKSLSSVFGIHAVEHQVAAIEYSIPLRAASTKPAPRRMYPGRRVHLQNPHRDVHATPVKGESRMPTFFFGNDPLEHASHKEQDRAPTIMMGENVDDISGLINHHHVNPYESDRAPTIILGENVDDISGILHSHHVNSYESDRAPTIMIGENIDSDVGSLPGSGNVSEIDEADDSLRNMRYLHVRHAGALNSAYLRNMRNPRSIPATPANSPVPIPVTTPHMPMVIVSDQSPSTVEENTEIKEESLDEEHNTFHMPTLIVEMSKGEAPIADSNPFDALADAPDPMGSPVVEKKKHEHQHHHHQHNPMHNHAGQASV